MTTTGGLLVSTAAVPARSLSDHMAAMATAAALLLLLRRAHHDRLVMEALELELRNFLADEALNRANVIGVLRRGERERVAHGHRAAGAADAVNVVLGIRGHVVVDHVRNAGDVDAARGYVGGDHHLVFSVLETGERLDALVLRAIRVKDGD